MLVGMNVLVSMCVRVSIYIVVQLEGGTREPGKHDNYGHLFIAD